MKSILRGLKATADARTGAMHLRFGGDNLRILKSLIIVVCFVGGAKVLGALKEIGLAVHYGTGPNLDAYALTFNLCAWPVAVFFSAISAVFVPLFVRLSEKPDERTEFFREAVGFTVFGGFLFAIVFAACLFALTKVGAFGLDGPAAAAALAMAFPIALIIPLGSLASLLSTRLMSQRKYINTLFEAAPSVVLLVAVLAIPHSGSSVLAWGTVAGYLAYVGLLVFVQPRPWGDLLPSLSWRSKHWADVGRGAVLMLIAQAIFTMGGAVADQVLASHMGAGSNATLGYANRLLMLLITLGATAVGRATLPVFSEARLRSAGEEVGLASRWMGILLVVSIVGVAIAAIFAPFAVRLLFRHGEFTERDAESVTELIRYGLLQIPFYLSGVVIVQLLASRQKYKMFIVANTLSVIVKIVSGVWLLKVMGLPGLMIASALMQAVSTGALYIFLQKERRSDALAVK